MHQERRISRGVAVAALVLSGCQQGTPDSDLGVGARLSVDYLGNSDVVGFHYFIERVSCNPGDPIEPFAFEALVDLQDQLAPGGVTVLDVFDDQSGHVFADVFVTLDPGCYDITATPVSAMDAMAGTYTASEDCSVATAEDVEVQEGVATEVPPLVSQCIGDPLGAGGVPVGLNHPPQFTLQIDDRFGFECEVLDVCARVSDEDGDPVELVWTQTAGAALYEPIALGPLIEVEFDGGIQYSQQCATFASEAVGAYAFEVTAYDLDAMGGRIEDLLDPVLQSRATMAFDLFTSRGVEPHCMQGATPTPVGSTITRAPGCDWQTPEAYYCDPANAADAGFDLGATCPGGVFDPSAAYPVCAAEYAQSCAELLAQFPDAPDGVYEIDRNGPLVYPPAVEVVCDMTTDGGGWTLVALNNDPTTFADFNRGWEDYRFGFGNLTAGANGWIGNDQLHGLTSPQAELLVRHDDGAGELEHYYDGFHVGSLGANYGMWVSTTPDSNDGGQFVTHHAGQPFSTYDNDNDDRMGNCADDFNAGWWYADCYAMSVASGAPGDQVYWRGAGGDPAFINDYIEMWVR